LNDSVDQLATSGWATGSDCYERQMSPQPAAWSRVCAAYGRMMVQLNYGTPTSPPGDDELIARILDRQGLPMTATNVALTRKRMALCATEYVAEAMAYADTIAGGLAASLATNGSPLPSGGDQVTAASYLAHAAATLSRWYTEAELSNPATVDLALKSSLTIAGTTWTLDAIRNAHANCLRLATELASTSPYDWRAPRPLNRAIAWDVPLLEWDLRGTPSSGTITGLSGALGAARMWPPIARQTVDGDRFNQDHAASTLSIPWGNPNNFTLTRPFDPSERCRQLVVWAVDWQSYEDAETAPSADVDASRYPIGAPGTGMTTFTARMGDAASDPAKRFFNDRYHFVVRNPEKEVAFIHDVLSLIHI
jgi:hypothetical protein